MNIKIKYRHYNGDFGEGSILNEEYSFKIKDNICTSSGSKDFCSNLKFRKNNLSSVSITMPFEIDDKSIERITKIIETIQKNKEYVYNEKRFNVDSFDFNKYYYTDIFVDDNHYELSNRNDLNILDELRMLFKIDTIDNVLKSDIKELIDLESKK